MPITPSSEINVIDPLNSTTTPLAAGATFTGTFVNVQQYTSVTTLFRTDSDPDTTTGLRFEWSSDGVNVDSETDPQVRSSDYVFGAGDFRGVAHATVQGAFFRVVYRNLFTGAQTFFRLQTLLRRGVPNVALRRAGSNEIFSGELAGVQRSILYGVKFSASPGDDIQPVVTSGGQRLFVRGNPNAQAIHTNVAASLVSVEINDGDPFSTGQYQGLSVYNDTKKGTLFLRQAATASTTNFQWAVPPRHTWHAPNDWAFVQEPMCGIWDIADGTARVTDWSAQVA